ncbi:hypothetical protein MNBD_ALPHA08-147 [hydrothermal vent metagenome]|uniref:Blue (type 1) copper domain-containing protein n=1 Tax=hydrothermal vent metagenome TaxID=652676 RepID=A0A3B0R9W0_9ZZZZ
MTISRRNVLALAATAVAASFTTPSFAAQNIVDVSLWDKGQNSMNKLGQGKMMGMGMAANMGMAPMGIAASVSKIPTGEITFKVKNDSTSFVHEMVLAKVADPGKPLPYDKEKERVDEAKAGDLGEVADLGPGQKGALTTTLKPGNYILYCNIPGHYALGMWTLLTVTG